MGRILVRADDLGYCESFNYGLARAVKSGIVRSVGVMANMEWAEHGVRLLDGCGVAETYAIGDCANPFNIGKAIMTGNDAGRAV